MESVYDRALSEVGPDGRFQNKFDVTYNVLLGALWVMSYMSLYLSLAIPGHHCKLPEKPANISNHEWKLKYIPVSSIDVDGQRKFSNCLIYERPNESNETIECLEYTYDKTWYETTVPSENNWVCSKELYAANIFTYGAIAEFLGNCVAGWFGDTYGRRLTYIYSLLLIVIGRIISILAESSYWIFACGICIASFPSWSIIQSTTVVAMEISSPERRTTTAVYRFTALSFGVCLLSLLYWWLREWKILYMITTSVLLPFLLFSWKYNESPRWLWTQGRLSESIKELKKIAKENKCKLNTDTEREFLSSTIVKEEVLGALALFSSWKLSINTILQLIVWMVVTVSYTVLVLMVSQKTDGNPFLEVSWQSLLEIPGSFVGAFLADHYGRRYAGIASCATTSLMWILMACREIYPTSIVASWWAGLIIRSTCRVSGITIFYIINLFNMELYPTCLRQSGMSLGNVLSSGGSAFAPYILYLGHQVNSSLPGVILAILSIIGLISFYLLPETLHAKLPETLEDARNFGSRKTNYFFIPPKSTKMKHDPMLDESPM